MNLREMHRRAAILERPEVPAVDDVLALAEIEQGSWAWLNTILRASHIPLGVDNVGFTPGTGATVAADDVGGGLLVQRVKPVWGVDGSMVDTSQSNPLPVDQRGRSTYVVSTGLQVNVAAARTLHFDIFNAVGSGIVPVIMGIYILPSLVAVTGVGLTWEIGRSTAVGTGGVALTVQQFNSTDTAVPAQVTGRGKPTGGVTGQTALLFPNTSSEETSGYATQATQINHVPTLLGKISGITLNEGEGLYVAQTTNSSIGSTNIVCVYTVG